jgi:drug/metabolite transporter (DMT)-like permease
MSESRRLAVYLIPYILMSSFQYQFAKDGLKFIDPLTFMGLRYLIAGTICFTIARNFRPILNKNTVLLSLFTFLSSALWATGLTYVSPAQSAVLSYTMPLFAIPLSILLLREYATRLVWTGAIIGFFGVVIYGIALTSSGGSLLGVALSVSNALFWALYSIYYRKLMNQNPVQTVATQFFLGGLMFFPFVPFTFFLNPTPAFFIDLGYVSLIGGVLTLLVWNALVRTDTIGRVTTLVFAVPAASVMIQSALTRELPSPLEIAGICVMFAGIYVSRLRFGARLSKASPVPQHVSSDPD